MAEPKTKKERELLKAVRNGSVRVVKKLLKTNFTELNDERYLDYQLIIEALKKSRIDNAKLLIENGFRVHKNPPIEKTILEYAVDLKDKDLITSMLAKGASASILVTSKQGKTPFHLAIERNQLSTIELFLSQFNVQTFDEKNFLHYAVEHDKIKVVEQLIKKGFSLKRKNEKNLTPFGVALINKKYKIVDKLLSHCLMKNVKLNNSDDIPLAYIASSSGNLQVIKQYIHSGLSINSPLKLTTDTWLCLDDCSGFTLLHFAVKHIQLKVVEFLLNKGADICVQDENGSSPLHVAFETKEIGIWETWQEFENNNSIIDLILETNMKFESNPVNKNGLSHFHIACSTDKTKVVEHFLKFDALINQPVNSQCHLYKGFIPLHFAAKFRCIKTLELLLKNGADVKQTNFERETALHIATKESCEDGVRLLLQYGADITAIDSHGNSPVHLAYQKQNYAINDLLLSVNNVADSNPVNTKGLSHFHIACTRNNVDVVKEFIANGASFDTCVYAQSDKEKNFHITDWSGYSPLHFAVSHNRAKIVELLLNSGANVEIKNSKGYTPLHTACEYTFTEIFREFINDTLCNLTKHGKIAWLQLKPITDVVKISEKHSGGFDGSIEGIDWSPNRKEHLKIISLLLSNGSDVNCKDNGGYTPVFDAYCFVVYVSELENNLNCSKALWSQIISSLSKELRERRKLILSDLLKREVDFDNCCKEGSILFRIPFLNEWSDYATMELFLKAGANPNVTDEERMTPLHWATLTECNIAVRVLLDYGANADCGDRRDNSTPLHHAARYLNFEIIKTLIDGGANVNARKSDGSTALHTVVDAYCGKTHNEHFNYPRDPFGENPQPYVDDDDIDPPPISIISALIEAGADINSRDSNGFTPLHVAWKLNIPAEKILSHFLALGADINVEDNQGRSVCCYLYKRTYGGYIFERLLKSNGIMLNHILKMRLIGLPISEKVLSSYDKIKARKYVCEAEETNLMKKCESEAQVLRDTKINDNCSLHNVLFKNENALSHLVKNPAFKSIVQSKSFEKTYPNYGYLIRLKYQAGLDRIKLLPIANHVLSSLAGLDLPDACSEHICSYFTNGELNEYIHVLSSLLDLKRKILKGKPLRMQKAHKRQRKA